MSKIKVVISGISGKMGQESLKAVHAQSDMEVIGGTCKSPQNPILTIPGSSIKIPATADLEPIITEADVVLDFTNSEVAIDAIRIAANHNVPIVTGSTGFNAEMVKEIETISEKNKLGIIVAPNFAIGAVLMMHLAKTAGQFFEFADLIESHHEQKLDSPSGTAISIAKAALENRSSGFTSVQSQKELIKGSRGGNLDGVNIHSSRMPGRVAHHELTFGTIGQTFTIKHDSINRESFMPGVIMAIKHIIGQSSLIWGLEKVMRL